MRQIVLDTETTGMEIRLDNRILEIGCVELINRKLTGNNYHVYINPERDSEEGALAVHGLTSEFLSDKPLFKDIAQEFVDYISGAELIIHNAPFDVGFLDHELKKIQGNQSLVGDLCSVVDSLALAKQMHPGQKNNLNVLCKRYLVDNSGRDLHGALLDAELLADVFLLMTGGQRDLSWESQSENVNYGTKAQTVTQIDRADHNFVVTKASEHELAAHEQMLQHMTKESERVLWLQQNEKV
jgi:DNA polymerase-3 subunit epsilon